MDCQRNGATMLAKAHRVSRGEKDSVSKLCALALDAGVEWRRCPAAFRHGTLVRRRGGAGGGFERHSGLRFRLPVTREMAAFCFGVGA